MEQQRGRVTSAACSVIVKGGRWDECVVLLCISGVRGTMRVSAKDSVNEWVGASTGIPVGIGMGASGENFGGRTPRWWAKGSAGGWAWVSLQCTCVMTMAYRPVIPCRPRSQVGCSRNTGSSFEVLIRIRNLARPGCLTR